MKVLKFVLNWGTFLLVCLGAWFFVGPAEVGGPVHYVIVDGSSMEPTYHDGDLVLVRSRGDYDVGDVVTYQPDLGGQTFPVIHRIVDVRPDGSYVTQGDNRDEPDDWLATDSNIKGVSWLHVPWVGSLISRLRQVPVLAAVVVGFGTLWTLKAMERRGRRRDDGEDIELGGTDGVDDLGPADQPETRRSAGVLVAVLAAVVLGTVAGSVGVRVFAAGLEVDGGVLQGYSGPTDPATICGGPCPESP